MNIANKVIKFLIPTDFVLESERVNMIDGRRRSITICLVCTPFFGQRQSDETHAHPVARRQTRL